MSHVALRALRAGDEQELLRIHSEPEVARWWGEPEQGFPWSDEPDHARLAIELEGAVVGMVQYWEDPGPRYRHATIDIFLATAVQGRGVGTEALRLLVAELTGARGHHRLTIDPASDNAAAIRCYEKVGFRAVGVMRAYDHRGGGDYRDALLMELVVV